MYEQIELTEYLKTHNTKQKIIDEVTSGKNRCMIYKYVYDEKIIYIGRASRNGFVRYDEHKRKDTKFLKYLDKAKFYVALVSNSELMKIYEDYYISLYKPELNDVGKKKNTTYNNLPELEWAEFDENEIDALVRTHYRKCNRKYRKTENTYILKQYKEICKAVKDNEYIVKVYEWIKKQIVNGNFEDVSSNNIRYRKIPKTSYLRRKCPTRIRNINEKYDIDLEEDYDSYYIGKRYYNILGREAYEIIEKAEEQLIQIERIYKTFQQKEKSNE